MLYTQLDFVSYSWKRRSLIKQAEFLLCELVAGRVHKFPCDCGACIYWAYRHRKKGEGRSFSARTFFVYFLRSDLIAKALAESLPINYGKLKEDSNVVRLEVADNRGMTKTLPPILITNVFYSRVRKAAKAGTLIMIRSLAETRQPPAVRAFLRGILNKKSFYTYYQRAGNGGLDLIVRTMRQDLWRKWRLSRKKKV